MYLIKSPVPVGQSISVTTGTVTHALGRAGGPFVLDNRGGSDVFVALGGASISAATATSLRVKTGDQILVEAGNATHIAVIGSGASTLVLTPFM